MRNPILTLLKRRNAFYFYILIIIAILILLAFKMDSSNLELNNINKMMFYTNTQDYIIYNKKCRLPNVDPMNPEVKHFYAKYAKKPCTNKPLLTYVTKNSDNTIATLHINESLIQTYSTHGVKCCYSIVTRFEMIPGNDPDNHISITECTDFDIEISFTWNPIMVHCRSIRSGFKVYSNVHVSVTITNPVKEKIKKKPQKQKPISVLFVAIDSISRLNMMRTLPLTRDYVMKNEWIEMQAYNKIGDNTYPNLMAILTGRNYTSTYRKCKPEIEGKQDYPNCDIIWYEYGERGFVTAYAEDEGAISTFQYLSPGFFKEPADYYYRPYVLAYEQLSTRTVDHRYYCTGPEKSGARILNTAKDFAVTFKDAPNFGFFWMNSFSHEGLNTPTLMDDIVKDFLVDLENNDVYENSIVILISDHGLRFGRILETHTGWYEERLPMFHMWIPHWFRKQHPVQYENLKNNQKKLTSPYDLHMTLQDVLIYSGANYTSKPSEGCPTCKSLFTEIEPIRSCEEAGISPHYCTCGGFESLDENTATVLEAGAFILSQIQTKISEYKESNKCVQYVLNRIKSARTSKYTENWYKKDTHYLIILETTPNAVFEATVKLSKNALTSSISFTLEEGISRLDKYHDKSECVHDSHLKVLCHCYNKEN